jgi:hypothetical protein
MSSITGWVDPRTAQLSIDQIVAYLQAHDWKQKAYPMPELLVFEGPLDDEGKPFLIDIPSNTDHPAYLMRMGDMFHILSSLEHRQPHLILEEMLQSQSTENRKHTPPNGTSKSTTKRK